jgi:hypothetical protein
MARKVIDVGVVGNDGTGDSIRDSFRKVNDNFRELYSSLGLGEKLTFIGLDDTPLSYAGQNNPATGSTPVLTINNTESGLAFKNLEAGTGLSIDFITNPDKITINSDFAEISGDPNPKLGGDLSAKFGTNQYRIKDLTTPITATEAVNKAYADTKVSRAGVDTVDPATGLVNGALGTMSGPLILSRSPEPEDDQLYDGLIAATKSYVDNAAFGSVANLFVATSGSDDRPGLSREFQGRALAYAYRTIEAACKRAEELVLDARQEIGPYKKILTYTKTAIQYDCTLALAPYPSPSSGADFAGTVRMGVSAVTLSSVGTNYFPGDILTISGGTVASGGGRATIEVLTTLTTPGAIGSFRIISSGSYSTTLPGSSSVATTITTSAAPAGIGAIGAGARFDITYKVNSVGITTGGTGYSLISVRITGGGGAGAFGTGVVTAGVVTSITITDQGSGFTSIPTLSVDLPRFAIKTEFQRTDFTGDVISSTAEAIRGRDIREGLFLFGETSGALAQILGHSGALDAEGNELFDVDIKYGAFQTGEVISYGDVTKNIHITILVESGIYEENYPLKVPQNTSIVGDEFRRCIIRPRSGTSSSPWAFQKFRRDLTIDGLTTAEKLYGYHYLIDTTEPVYPRIDNKGAYTSAAALIDLNRQFLQNEVIAWIASQVATNTAPFTSAFTYNAALCKRDVGLILDAMVFDLKWGEYNRTVSAALKYYQSASGLIAINAQISQTLAAVTRLNTLVLSVIANTAITPSQTASPQIVDLAYAAESGSSTVLNLLFTTLKDIMDESGPGYGSVNQPKNNDQLDVFLANDAVRWQGITCQGHGGFMLTLDPAGQILAKSPYAQECASFSKSKDAQVFAGGMFVDGFAGNLQWRHNSSDTTTRLNVSGLARFPQLPASFLVDDTVFRVNYVRDFVYIPSGSTATFILDETTPFTRTAGAQTCTISSATPAVITKSDHRMQSGAIITFSSTGTLPSGISAGEEYFVMAAGLTNNTFQITATFGSTTAVNTTSVGSGTHSYQRTYELLMPGNRSMLSNDYTQINDLGYGILATNGGLVEAVSMFTYYAHISYYSLNGGQIRSIGGSSAHGTYALVAEGADPLEIPTPTGTFEELAQKVKCYAPSPAYANTTGGLFIFVHAYDYRPLGNAEVEIDHGGTLGIYRYPVTSVTISDEYPTGVARLNLSSGIGSAVDGLADDVPDNTLMTYRLNGQIILTGSLVNVAVRPSTGLKLRETEDFVYRVLEFASYTDSNGPYEVSITNASPAVLKVLATVITIATNVCTTSQNHKLKVGDKFIPTSTANNFVSGTTYYILTVPEYNQFTVSTAPGGSTFVLTNGSGLTIRGVKTHKLLENYTVGLNVPTVSITGTISGTTLTVASVISGTITAGMILSGTGITANTVIDSGSGSTWTLSISHTIASAIPMTGTGTLPTGTAISTTYYVLPDGLTDTEFRLSLSKNGTAINTSSAGIGVPRYAMVGLTKTSLRENYDYNDLTLWQPGEFISTTPTGTAVTDITLASPGEVQLVSHGFNAGDVIKFTTSGSTINLPLGLSKLYNYHVLATGLTVDVFRVSLTPGGAAVDTSGTFTDARVGKVTGRIGDSAFAVVPVGGSAVSRIDNSKFVFKGVEYIITNYETEGDTGQAYARVNLDKPLVDNVISYPGVVTIKSAVPTRSNGALGTLTIRISLTRVTSHDLLEIGTGSYADTNYPSEIFGAAVNTLQPDDEVEERDVGRVFYVTTDQYGNFNVGPFFRVDQGTGTVTFSSSIALSNLDGIGFKRGVTVAEFSPDSGFELARTDTVPTENAIRKHVERRLGVLNDGLTKVDDDQLLPPNDGGFMPLKPPSGLGMKADMPLGGFKIVDVGNPTLPEDAVNLRSLTFDNFQDVSTNTVDASDILVFTGAGNNAVNATVTGDITFDLRTGIDSALNTIDVQINANTIINADVNSAAAIDQAKLNLDSAYATVVSGFTGATATGSGSVATLTFSSSSAITPFTAGQRIVVSGLSVAGYNGIQTVTGGTASTVTYASTTTGSATGGTIRPLNGISSFDTTQFTVTDGFVTLKSNGTAISRLEQISSLTVLGNSSLGTSSVSQVAFSTVVDTGGAIKKSQYSSTGFLRRTSGVSSVLDGDYTVVEAAAGSSASVEASKIVIRDSNGDFGGRTVDISQLKMDTKLTIDTATTASGGYIRYYGYDTAGGILISDGTLATDKVTAYWNNAHNFKTQNGASDAPITCSQIQTQLLTTGAVGTLGDVTGNWRLTSGSKLQATYSADLAEWYTSDKKHEPGTVLVFGGDAETTTTNIEGDTRVAGVVSTDPAYVLNGQLETVENAVCVALQGRVPCRVVGKIKKGQMLITSKISGVAVAGGDDIKVGTVVGKALVDYDSDHIGTIEIAVGRT